MRINPTRDRFVALLSRDQPLIDEETAEDIYDVLLQQELRESGRRERVISLDRYCERKLKAKGGEKQCPS